MSKKFSQFTTKDTVDDSDYINVTGSGVNRRVVWPDFLDNIYDRIVTPFIYPTIEKLQEAPLQADEDSPTYVRCEETEYRLYKITNESPGEDDIVLDNGNTATYQVEYRDIGFVIGPDSSTPGSIPLFADSTGNLLSEGPTPSIVGNNFIEFPDSVQDGYFRKKTDNTLELLTGDQLKTNLSLNNVNNTTDLNKPISTATQAALDLKAPLASPALTGTPTSTTAAPGTNTTQIATTAFVISEISNITDTAETFADLSAINAVAGYSVVNLKAHTSNGVGGGVFDAIAQGHTATDGGQYINSATAGVRWRRRKTDSNIFHVDEWGGDFEAAIDYLPENSVLELGNDVYDANFQKTKSFIHIVGACVPEYNAGKTALENGTIIRGMLHIVGDGVIISNLGIDCGSDACTAINGGTAMDALVLMDPSRTIRTNCSAQNIICLLKEPTSAFHNFLLEGLKNCYFKNLTSRYGHWGCVLKTQDTNVDGITSYACSQAGMTFKSDTGVLGSPALSTNVSNVIIDNTDYTGAAQGILIYAASSSCAWFNLNNYQINGGLVGLKLLCDTRAANVNLLFKSNISNGVIRNCTNFGFESFGAVNEIKISNLTISDTDSDLAIKIWSDCNGIDFQNITASSPNANSANIDCSGRFTFNNVKSIVGGDYSTKSGINLAPDNYNVFKLTDYIGNLTINGVSDTWTPAYTNLTVVNGTGGIAHTGRWSIVGNYVVGQAYITPTGTATSASAASSTRINNLPLTVINQDALSVVRGDVATIGLGLVQSGGTNAFTPTWAADNGQMTISFRYQFQ